MRTVQHPESIPESSCVSQFLLCSLLDDAVKLFQGADSLLYTDRVAYLNGAGQCLLCLDRLVSFKVIQIRAVERIGPLSLCNNNSWQSVNQTEVSHHKQSAAESRDIAEVAPGNDYHIRRLPVKLLNDLDADGLLTLNTQRVHRIGQIYRLVIRNFLHNTHAAVEV